MKKLVFITGEDLLDVDLPVVKELHSKYDFYWIIILRGYGWFPKDRMESFLKEHKIPGVILLQNFKLKSPKTLLFHIKLLSKLRSLKADIYYDSYLGSPFLHLISAFFISREKFVLAIHDVVLHFKMNNYAIRNFYFNFLKKNFSNIHVFSENQKKVLESQQPGKNVLLAPLCLKDFGKPKMKHENPYHRKNFLFFGILRENKGIERLVKVAKKLSGEYKNFTVTIAGKSDGDCWERIKDEAENDPVFKLIIRTIANEEVADLLSSAYFMVLPYKDATQSGVLLTSYMYQLPVIASDLKGFKEYVTDDYNGYLFEGESTEALYKKMKMVLDMPESEYSRIKKNLADFIDEKINTRTISEKYVSYFNNLN